MKIIGKAGKEDIAVVYIGETESKKIIEFVESIQPPIPRSEKWVLIVSTLCGCPVKCLFCDAGGYYEGKLTSYEILEQIDFLVQNRFLDKIVAVKKFKIQFARIGEPAYNDNLIEVLEELPGRYNAPGLMVCISTIAPEGTDKFFERLLKIKKEKYPGRFQLQFSIHTTEEKIRDYLMPVRKWKMSKIAEYGKEFFEHGDRKIGLNFALAKGVPVDPDVLLKYFEPKLFVVKITPINPTLSSIKNKIVSEIVPEKKEYELIDNLRKAGYEVILSIGELEENQIGSNCGQYITHYLKSEKGIDIAYTYPVKREN